MKSVLKNRESERRTAATPIANLLRTLPLIFGALSILFAATNSFGASMLTLQTGGGIAISGSYPAYSGAFGNVNGLGAGTPTAGLIVIPSTSSVLYTSPYAINLNLSGNQTAGVTAYVSGNFGSATNVAVYSCPVGGSCGAASGYSPLSLNPASPTTVASSSGSGNSTAYIAIWVNEANGTSAFNSTQSATVTLVATRQQGVQTDTVTLTLTATGQSAVSLQIQSAPGGLAVTPGADFAMNFGFVNGLGAGTPQAGLSTVSVPGGTVYVTRYSLLPAFSNLSSTTGSLSVRLSMNFSHPAALVLQDASSAIGPFTTIPSGSSLSLTTTAGTEQNISRYLGLLVNQVNGPTAFAGADTATLTYTLTVL